MGKSRNRQAAAKARRNEVAAAKAGEETVVVDAGNSI
jgi:hypothetical protein